MHRFQLLLVPVLGLLACGASKPDAGAIDAATSEACRGARELRSAAIELERTGHLLLARGKLDAANAACLGERATSRALEARVLADLGDCTKAAAVSIEGDAGATAAEVKTLCDVRTAASLGTDVAMRAKMREAFNAARAKDYARARSLFLDAWTQHHPNPLALEDAARMATLAGDAAGARRTRDRALAEAEEAEHTTAIVTNRVRASAGDARLANGTLTVADAGKVVARDLATGEVRALLDVDAKWMKLSPLGTLVMTTTMKNDVPEAQVYDLLTGQPLLDGERVHVAIPSQDDALIVVGDEGKWRVVDVATGDVRAKLEGDAFAGLEIAGFGSGSTLVMLARQKDDDGSRVLRVWDLQKQAFGPFTTASRAFVGLSLGGRYVVSVTRGSDGADPFEATMPLAVRDLEAGTTVAQWLGRFGSVDGLSVSPGATTVATESQNSVRLWDVATKKQTFIAARTRRGDNYDSDLGHDAFSDDGKTVVLGREARTMLWDVATGVETEVVSNQRRKDVLRIVPFGEVGIVLVTDDDVRVVPFVGDAHALCKGFHQRYYPDVGPTNAVVSPSGKSLACSMSGGAVHVFDTATWQERSHFDGPAPGTFKQTFAGYVWDGIPPAVRPVDLAFSTDDAALTVVSDATIATYDATTGKQLSKVALRAPKLALAARHALLDGGRVLVKTTSGSGAVFDATGVFDHEVKLVPDAPINAPDAFSADGKTYAIAIGTVLHTVDVASGRDATNVLPVRSRTLALSPDGKASVIVGTDGVVYEVGGDSDAGAVNKAETGPARRAFLTAKARIIVTDPGDTLELFVRGHTHILEVDPNGLVARNASGTFELRGKPEAECAVGRVHLTEETCADRAESGLVEAWLRDAH